MTEFIELVRRMRAAQKAYFKFRNISDLRESKRLEGEVDHWITQASLDNEEPPPDARQGLLPWED